MGDYNEKNATVGVFCGSSLGSSDAYLLSAIKLGEYAAAHRLPVVYGGGADGLMGAVADSVIKHGGEVIGVFPNNLRHIEKLHPSLTKVVMVSDSAERKRELLELSDFVVVFPGGIGTLEELFETWSKVRMGEHNHPVGLLNIEGYFDPLICFLEGAITNGFIKPKHMDYLVVRNSVERLIADLIELNGKK